MNSQAVSLRKRTFKAGSWVLIGHFFSQFMRLGGNLILTRLLVPEMFGVMVIVNVVMTGLAMFSDIGLLQNIVQSKRGQERNYLNTAWTIQIIRGFLIFFVTLVISASLYFLNQFGYLSPNTAYGNAELPSILAVMSVTAVIAGFNSIQLPLLNRKLMMGKLVMIEVISQLVGLVFMVLWAWMTHDIWALVCGSIISVSSKMVLSHTVKIGERCCFSWDREAAHEIIHFGKWIFISSIFGFLLNQGDRILLGGLISPEILGVYTVAFFLANALKDLLAKLINSVFYPVLSETVRYSPEKLENIYYKIRYKIDAVTFFVAGFIYSSGEMIVNILYDFRYQDAGWMLEVLGLSVISTGFLLSGQCFLAHGLSKVVTSMIFVQVLSFYLMLPFLFMEYGMPGAVWSVVAASYVRVIVSSIYMKKYFFYNIKKEFLMIPVAFIGFVVGNLL